MIDPEGEVIHMDFSREEQVDGRGSFREFFCASCGRPLERRLQERVLRTFEYE